MTTRPYIVGNWKMNGTRAMLSEARAIDRAAQRHMKVEVALAPPFTLIHAVHREAEQIAVGAQDCHRDPDGAHTGDVSATMLADAGAKFVILGHSERRAEHSEQDAIVREKLVAAQGAGLEVILCCGETDSVRDAGGAEGHVLHQLENSLPDEIDNPGERLTIAYEPVWAIGTGRTPTMEEIGAMHASIRQFLIERFGEEAGAAIRILYGGSVKPDNAREILAVPEVGGALVGGASLTADSFMNIALAATEGE
ncbi:triose-phosphate isomerase [Erythrobacter sp. 3-20A1M]|uniref:triose-phosphate isomerase n=1 Tax=Erythrobacter sp. 3-20A1M TaxID=2653850 RepID=UPI001BFC1023|nr:triose-phosphate isomerase [Erythrobacter sp. 3-20A1M]QWC58099.1 triose-phosphate isomerase [Erythrobacter sp. 3-20A1M]